MRPDQSDEYEAQPLDPVQTLAVRRSSGSTLVAALALSCVYGSIHAFSVFTEPLEMARDASRTEVVLAYSLALASLTVAVGVGHRLYARFSPPTLIMSAGVIAAAGLALSATTPSVVGLWVGYGLLFGFANGIGYGLALHLANQHFVDGRSLAMGSVTAIYAVGAAAGALALEATITATGAEGALVMLAIAVGGVSLLAATIVSPVRAPVDNTVEHLADGTAVAAGTGDAPTQPLDSRLVGLAWLTYGTAVAAGLMAMGHAASIITEKGGSSGDGASGVVVIAIANACAGFGAGWVASRYRPEHVLSILAIVSTVGLLALALLDGVATALIAFALVGIAYGATISIFPVLTTNLFGVDRYARAYGRIFTSWGTAGLAAPWFAGVLFAQTGSYAVPLGIAAVFSLASAAVAGRLGSGR